MLARGESIGVFQFECSGMREALRSVKPTVFEDLIALVALYRPGPMQYIPVYARRKNGQEPVTYPDERLKPLTASTYGICIYQEQYMEIAKQIAGFSPAEADDLRKAIGKKIHSLMASLKEQVPRGLRRKRHRGRRRPPALGRHGAGAGLLVQQVARRLLRADLLPHRLAAGEPPAEYMAALISSVMNTKDKVPFYVNACDELGIEVLPPDVNESQVDFAVVEGKIRFGLNAVKNVGEAACARDRRGARGGRPVRVDLGLHRACRPVRSRTSARSSRSSSAARSTRPAPRAGGCSTSSSRRSRYGQKLQQPTGCSGRARSSTSATRPRRQPRTTRRSPTASSRRATAAAGEGDARPLRLRASARRRSATSCGGRPTARSSSSSGAATARSSSSAASSRRCKQMTTKKGEPMAFVQLEDVTGRRGHRLQLDLRGRARVARRRRRARRQGPHRPQAEGETKLVALEVAAFEAVPERREVRLKVDARRRPRRRDP